jgi:hypothetical protein
MVLKQVAEYKEEERRQNNSARQGQNAGKREAAHGPIFVITPIFPKYRSSIDLHSALSVILIKARSIGFFSALPSGSATPI